MKEAPPPTSVRRALVFAVIAYFVIHAFIPFGTTLLYPLTLFATWVHEMGHGLTALTLGGHFSSLDVYANASGLAFTTSNGPWQSGLVAMGGLLAPPIVGAALLAISRGPKRAQAILIGLAIAIVASLAIWVRSTTGWVALPLVALLIGYFAHPKYASPGRRMVFVQFLGVILAIDTVSRIDYLFTREVTIAGKPLASDIVTVAHGLGGLYLLWGVILAAVSLGFLALGLFLAWRR
jgi:hypothetical protein